MNILLFILLSVFTFQDEKREEAPGIVNDLGGFWLLEEQTYNGDRTTVGPEVFVFGAQTVWRVTHDSKLMPHNVVVRRKAGEKYYILSDRPDWREEWTLTRQASEAATKLLVKIEYQYQKEHPRVGRGTVMRKLIRLKSDEEIRRWLRIVAKSDSPGLEQLQKTIRAHYPKKEQRTKR